MTCDGACASRNVIARRKRLARKIVPWAWTSPCRPGHYVVQYNKGPLLLRTVFSSQDANNSGLRLGSFRGTNWVRPSRRQTSDVRTYLPTTSMKPVPLVVPRGQLVCTGTSSYNFAFTHIKNEMYSQTKENDSQWCKPFACELYYSR